MSGVFAQWQPAYAERHIATFPVVVSADKKPAVRGYLKIGSEVSRQLALKFSDCNALGFALGQRSRIVVLDIDTRDERVLADALSRHGSTPIIVRSGSGNFQAWYRHRGEPRRIKPWPGRPIDLLGGGFVVAPPSKGTKGVYKFVQGGLADLDGLPPIRNIDFSGSILPAASPAPRPLVREGERNTNLWRACMKHAHTIGGLDDLVAFARERNAEFSPPLGDEEVTKVAASAWRFTERRQNFFGGMWAGVIDHLAAEDADAFALLSILRRCHGGREEFALAKVMAAQMGWTLPRWRRARERLEVDGFVLCIHPGGRGPNDPPIYAWPTRSAQPQQRGTKSLPNITYTSSILPLPPSRAARRTQRPV